MDGLSAASSGIAVVSLAIQLVDSVRQIHRFLRRVSEAPKELKRLLDLLDQLELIIEHMGELVEKRRKLSGDTDIDVSSSVLNALKTCESKLEMVQDLIQKSKVAAGAKGQAARSLGSLRLAFRNKDIEEVERQLHDAPNRLNLATTMDLMSIQLQTMEGIGNLVKVTNHTSQAVSTVSNEMVLLRTKSKHITNHSSDIATSGNEMSQNLPLRQSLTKTSQRRSETLTAYTGLFGRILVRKTSSCLSDKKSDSTENTVVQTDRTWILVPSFLARSVEIEFKESFGFVQPSIRVRICIPRQHPIWEMCRAGNIQGIQGMFSRGDVSPFSINSSGRTMLHVAADCFQTELCRLLSDLGLDKEIEGLGHYRHRAFMQITRARADAITNTYNLLAPRAGYADISDFCWYLFSRQIDCEFEAQALIRFVKEWITRWNIEKFAKADASPIPAVLRAWQESPHHHNELRKTIQYLLALGLNIHATGIEETLIVRLMDLADHPFDSPELCDIWLNILGDCGVDVGQYLQQEMKFLAPTGPSSFRFPYSWRNYAIPSRQIIFSLGYKPRVYWDYVPEPGGPAFQALSEFRHFGTVWRPWWRARWIWNWPYMYSRWQEISLRLDERKTLPNSVEARLLELADKRFARRCQKQAWKIAKAQGLHAGPKLPGSWID